MAAVGAFVLGYRGTVCQPQDAPAIILSLAAAGIAAGMADPGLGAQLRHRRRARRRDDGRQRPRRLAARPPAPRLRRPLHPVPGARRLPRRHRLPAGHGRARHRGRHAGRALEPRRPPRARQPGQMAALGDRSRPRSRSPTRRVAQPARCCPWRSLAAGAGLLPDPRAPRARPRRTRGRAACCSGPFSGGGFLPALGGWRPLDIDWRALAAQAPSILTVVGLTSATALLSASALEVAHRHPHRPRPRPARDRPLQPRRRGRRRAGRLPCALRDAARPAHGLERPGERAVVAAVLRRRARLRRLGDLGASRSASSRC